MSSEPVAGARRFSVFDDPEPPPLGRRVQLLSVLVPLVALAAILTAVLKPGPTAHRTVALPKPLAVALTTGNPLPGESATQARNFRILGPATGAKHVGPHAAATSFLQSAGLPVDPDRKVLAAFVRVASLDQQNQRHDYNLWIVSLWFHPGTTGSGPNTWCVDHGIVTASGTFTEGTVYGCPLPRGTEPHPIVRS